MPKRQHIIIIGAGPGGLAAAIALAPHADVTVIERAAWPGGRMGRIEAEGYAFDTGPSILQYPKALDDVFAMGGARREDYVDLMPVEPYTRLRFWDDTTLKMSRDPEQLGAAMERLSPGLGARFERWAADHKRKHAIAYDTFIASPADSVAQYFNPLRTAPAAQFKPWETLHQCLMGYFDDERITYALSYPAKYLGLHPTSCSSIFSVISYLEHAFGVWHPRGGFRAMADGMQRCAEDLGATFRFNAPVAELLIDEGIARGVRLSSGERLLADRVVCNADFAWANQALIAPKWRPRYSDTKLHRMKYSCSTFMMYLGLDRRYAVDHHAIYLSDHVRRTDPASIEDAALDLEDPPFYVCNPCATEGSSAPEGHSTLYVLVPCPNTLHSVDWQAQGPKLREVMMDRLGLLGYEGVRDHVRFERIYNAQTWREEYNVFQGAVFNLSHTWGQLGPLRPHCESEDVGGLYWVGGGTHPGSGLLTIFESARIAARKLLETPGPARRPPPPGRLARLASSL